MTTLTYLPPHSMSKPDKEFNPLSPFHVIKKVIYQEEPNQNDITSHYFLFASSEAEAIKLVQMTEMRGTSAYQQFTVKMAITHRPKSDTNVYQI